MADKTLIQILKNIALLLELRGENPFKSRAYSNAAQIIEEQSIDVAERVRQGTLTDIDGFGKALREKISDYVLNGRMAYYDKIKAEIPESLLLVTKIAGIGPKKAKKLHDELGIESLEDLEKAGQDGRIGKVKGFGKKTQEAILSGIHHYKANKGRLLQEQARSYARDILENIRTTENVIRADISGDYRRHAETISQIDIVVDKASPKEAFLIDDKIAGKLIELEKSGTPVNFHISDSGNYFFEMHWITGSKKYMEELRKLALEKGFELNSSGIFKNGDGIILQSEEQLYDMLGMQFVPPELRESFKAIEVAIENSIPRLVEHSDIKGILHCHSTWSDGHNSIEEMALRAKELGYSYFGISDHSQSAAYANGLTPDRVKRQHEEIDRLNEKGLGIRIFKGIESDVLPDGSLDYDEEVLESFDFVVASVHSAFRLSREQQTRRIICALQSPYTTILGHPTGRLLLVRKGYDVDIHEVIDAAAEYNKIIEINANPYRLDLAWENVIYAKEKGVKIAVNPDSHRIETIGDLRYGVNIARKGWLEKEDVVNCLDAEEFKKEIFKNE